MNEVFKKMRIFSQVPDVLAAVGILMILVVMIVPIHPFILDLLLALSLAFSVVIMLVALYTKKPLDFSVFPSVLLISTLFRLALNVASTRNILIHGATDGIGSFFPATNSIIGQGPNGATLILELIIAAIMIPYLWRIKSIQQCQSGAKPH